MLSHRIDGNLGGRYEYFTGGNVSLRLRTALSHVYYLSNALLWDLIVGAYVTRRFF